MADTFQFKTAAGQTGFSSATSIEAYAPLYPFPQNTSAIIYRERFMQLRTYYTRPPVNTPHPNLPQVYFANDTDFQDRPGGIIEWTRVYVTIPDSWNDFESYAYSFPGYTGTRVPFTRTVTAKLTKDYFAVGTLPTFQSNITSGLDSIASWALAGVSLNANASSVPALVGGATNATVVLASGSGEHWTAQGSNAAGGNSIAISIFAKPIGTSRITLYLKDNLGNNVASVATDLETLNYTATNTNAASVRSVGDGWVRVGLAANVTNANAGIYVYLGNSSGSTNYTANGESIALWRPQLAPNTSIPHATRPPTVAGDGTNYPVQSADLIPVKFGQLYLYNWSGNVAAEFLSSATTPTLANYQANVNIDQNSANPNSYSIEATDSVLGLWQGSIWERTRTFVKAR